MKKNDTIKLRFAGSIESGTIQEIKKEGNTIISYIVWDGKYTYNVKKENIKNLKTKEKRIRNSNVNIMTKDDIKYRKGYGFI